MDFVVGQTYTREEINRDLGVPDDCECRIVAFNDDGMHYCEES